MNVIGILGGTGEIGKRVINNLKNEFNIIASYHSNLKDFDKSCNYEKVDINNRNELENFCRKCNILINCAGASYRNGEIVARTAAKLKLPYIDPSGEAFLEKKLEDLSNKNIFILSSGFYPGMSGLLMKYVCSYFDEPISLEGYCINEEVPSYSAIEDFILTNLSGFGIPLSYYFEGEVLKDNAIKKKNIKNKNYKLQNYLTMEISRVAKDYNLKMANWYNNSFDEKIINMLQEVVIKIKEGTADYKDIINNIILKFDSIVDTANKFSYINITGTGIKNSSFEIKKVEVTSEVSSELSAIIASYAVRKVVNSEMMKNGIYYAMDILDFQEIINNINNLKMDLDVTRKKEIRILEEYDEGEI